MSDTSSSPEALKEIVRATYTDVVTRGASCCGTTSCCGTEAAWATFNDDYAALEGYTPEADYGLGCGLPTEHAGIRPGDTVLDLGSGAGNDVFVARTLAGAAGRVIGVDFTPAMVEKARANAVQLDATNVEFRLGDIEALPVADGEVDVVVSNCVLNLVPDKPRAFAEMHRVLRAGGRFCVSDIVTRGALPPAVRNVAALYAGCVSGAVEQETYVRMLEEAGFVDVRVVKEKVVSVPDEVLEGVLSPDELRASRESGGVLLSATVVGTKPPAG